MSQKQFLRLFKNTLTVVVLLQQIHIGAAKTATHRIDIQQQDTFYVNDKFFSQYVKFLGHRWKQFHNRFFYSFSLVKQSQQRNRKGRYIKFHPLWKETK